jgi:hypothetical protein
VEEFGKNTPEALQADEPVTSHEVETPMLDGSPSDDHDPATNGVENAEIAAKAKASKKSLAAWYLRQNLDWRLTPAISRE